MTGKLKIETYQLEEHYLSTEAIMFLCGRTRLEHIDGVIANKIEIENNDKDFTTAVAKINSDKALSVVLEDKVLRHLNCRLNWKG
jgi:hypothetical protein